MNVTKVKGLDIFSNFWTDEWCKSACQDKLSTISTFMGYLQYLTSRQVKMLLPLYKNGITM